MKHEMPKLNYPLDGLKPRISEDTMKFHYGKHLQAYTDNLNKLIKGTELERPMVPFIIMLPRYGITHFSLKLYLPLQNLSAAH